MYVSLRCDSRHDIVMKEVSNEKEAFLEMASFLEANEIESTVTDVYTYPHECDPKYDFRCKLVTMSWNAGMKTRSFLIRYDTLPTFMRYPSNEEYSEYMYTHLMNCYDKGSSTEWQEPYRRYLEFAKKRGYETALDINDCHRLDIESMRRR